ncbi:hypothetical protein [Rhizobium leguminosarum]|uniref:hypothetical protein n=1 Tax=Rhizobium leguminosarum TaxID=384 RepID=UPI003F9CE065
MEEVTIAGKVMVPVGGAVLMIDYVVWDNRAWLTPNWLENAAGTLRRPIRVIAPKMAPGFTAPSGADFLDIFTQTGLPQSVLDQGHIPPEFAPILEVVENPEIFIQAQPAAG